MKLYKKICVFAYVKPFKVRCYENFHGWSACQGWQCWNSLLRSLLEGDANGLQGHGTTVSFFVKIFIYKEGALLRDRSAPTKPGISAPGGGGGSHQLWRRHVASSGSADPGRCAVFFFTDAAGRVPYFFGCQTNLATFPEVGIQGHLGKPTQANVR